MKPKVKICGITNVSDALHAVWHGADALGFVFYKKSPRCITPSKAKRIIAVLPPWVVKIGLFVNEKVGTIKTVTQECGLDFIQLHGDEERGYVRRLQSLRVLRTIKAIRVRDTQSLKNIDTFPCDLLLFDAYSLSAFGGTGKSFDWRLAKTIRTVKKPYIISGGLTAKNVAQAVKEFRPYAVDVSSGVESSPGKKSTQLMKEFIHNAKRQ